MPGGRFSVQPAQESWVVIDRDGRPVSDLLSHEDASSLCDDLNLAAYGGRDTLAEALGAEI